MNEGENMRYIFAFLALIAATQIYVIAAPDASDDSQQKPMDPAVLELRESSGIFNQLIGVCGEVARKSTWTSIDNSQFKAVAVHESKDDGSCTP